MTAVLQGPEQVFRFTLTRPVANFGVVITRRNAGVKVEPRIVEDGDENRLTGYAALPTNLNPYLEQFGNPVLAAAAIRPLAGQLRHRLRQRHRRRGRRVRVPLLGRRHAAAVPQAHAGSRPPQRPARRSRHGSRLGHRCDDDQGHDRRQAVLDDPGRGHAADPDDRRQAREAQAPAPGVRLPGVAQHGERAADPAQHARAVGRDRDPVGTRTTG